MKKDWSEIRRAYEDGKPVSLLAQFTNVKAREIRERAAAEAWGPNSGEAARDQEQARKRGTIERRMAAAGALRTMPADEREALLVELLTRYLAGETIEEMRGLVGAKRGTLYYFLLGGADEGAHSDLITQALTARVSKADYMLENATGPVEIARAREMARFYRLDLERRRPATYGQQRRIEVSTLPADFAERLRRAQSRVRDSRTIDVLPAPEQEAKE